MLLFVSCGVTWQPIFFRHHNWNIHRLYVYEVTSSEVNLRCALMSTVYMWAMCISDFYPPFHRSFAEVYQYVLISVMFVVTFYLSPSTILLYVWINLAPCLIINSVMWVGVVVMTYGSWIYWFRNMGSACVTHEFVLDINWTVFSGNWTIWQILSDVCEGCLQIYLKDFGDGRNLVMKEKQECIRSTFKLWGH